MRSRLRKLCNRIITRVLTLLGFSSSLAFMACYGPPPSDDYIEVFPGELDMTSRQDVDEEVTIVTDGNWKARHIPPFVSLSDTAGTGRTTIFLTATEANQDKTSRLDSLVIESEKGDAVVHISQQPAD